MKILLIAGGWSSEREVSLTGAKGMESALKNLGHEVRFCDLLTDFDNLIALAERHDFAMLNLHGTPGEDGLVQAMLESAGCPYLGAGPAASFLGLNKAVSKQIFRHRGLPTADWEYLPVRPGSDWQPKLPYPVFAKANLGGSSLHMGRARNKAELDAIVSDIFDHHDTVIIEPELKGREVTCAQLGDEALPPILIEPVAGDFFDYESKYRENGAREICPAPLPADTIARIQELTLKACNALGLEGYGRCDFILGEDGGLTLLEVNTLPGMTPASLVPKEAKAIGLDFPALLTRLMELGFKRAGKPMPK
jgi:D-alanine-D-alanine ligase